MPVASISLLPNATTISLDDVRGFLRDYVDNNILLDNVQFTNAELQRALDYAVDEYNVFTPVSSGDASNIPKSILILGVASWLMKSESFLQLRNQATYQDGDIQPIGIDDKHQLYLQASRALKEEWQSVARAFKQQQNLESVYGSISSGYRNVGRFHNN